MSQQSLDLFLGSVEDKRPIATALRAQRGWAVFDSKESALRWASRNAPKIPAGVSGVSAHPRARKTDSGSYALVYDGVDTTPRKFVLNRKLTLERMR